MKRFAIALLACFMAGGLSAIAAPVPEDERITLDLRRTTLVVRDTERSLKLYRDVLGMKVIYDKELRTPPDLPDAQTEKIRRLVFLQANDDFIGILGLLEYKKPAKSQPIVRQAFEPGTAVLVFNTEKVEEKIAAASAIDGVEILAAPELVHYPGYDGTTIIPVMVSTIYDPDGFVLEINQVLGKLGR